MLQYAYYAILCQFKTTRRFVLYASLSLHLRFFCQGFGGSNSRLNRHIHCLLSPPSFRLATASCDSIQGFPSNRNSLFIWGISLIIFGIRNLFIIFAIRYSFKIFSNKAFLYCERTTNRTLLHAPFVIEKKFIKKK